MSTEYRSQLVIGYNTINKNLIQILKPLLIEYDLLENEEDFEGCILDLAGNVLFDLAFDHIADAGVCSTEDMEKLFGNSELTQYFSNEEESQFGIGIIEPELSIEDSYKAIQYATKGLERLFEINGLSEHFDINQVSVFTAINSF